MTSVLPEEWDRPSTASRPVLLALTSTYPRWQDDPEPGFVHELAKRLTDRFRVVVACPHAPGAPAREVLEGVEVHRYRYAPQRWETLVNDGGIVTNLRRSPFKLLLVPSFVIAHACMAWRLCRRFRVDVIHAHWLIPQGLVAACLQWLPGRRVPFIVTSHGADLYALRGRTLDALKRFVSRRASCLTVVSSAMRQELARIGADVAKCKVLPMGVDLEKRFTPGNGERSRNEILFVGRLVEKKGVHVLLQAMPRILEAHPGTHLNIVGFGPEEERLRVQAEMLGVLPAVKFTGAVSQQELPRLYQRAALFVAPFIEATGGDREGLGLVTIEAIACGCPIVVGDLPAVRDVLGSPEDKHMLFPPGDTKALARAVIHRLSVPVDDEQMTRLRSRLLGRFDWRAVAEAYGNVLQKVGSRP